MSFHIQNLYTLRKCRCMYTIRHIHSCMATHCLCMHAYIHKHMHMCIQEVCTKQIYAQGMYMYARNSHEDTCMHYQMHSHAQIHAPMYTNYGRVRLYIPHACLVLMRLFMEQYKDNHTTRIHRATNRSRDRANQSKLISMYTKNRVMPIIFL